MSIGKKLKNRRNELGLTQQQVAESINVSRKTISNWEVDRNYPDIPTIIILSDFYQISLDSLLKGDDKLMDKIKKDTSLISEIKKLERNMKLGFAVVTIISLIGMFFIRNDTLTYSLMAIAFVLLMFSVYNLIKLDKLGKSKTNDENMEIKKGIHPKFVVLLALGGLIMGLVVTLFISCFI